MVRLAGCKWIQEVKVPHRTCPVAWEGKSEVSAYWPRNYIIKKIMFSFRFLVSLGRFRTNSLLSKATLNKFRISDVCSAEPQLTPRIKLCWVGCLCFCLAEHLWLCQALLLHLLYFTEHFCLQYPAEMPWSSSDQSPAPPCTLSANNPACASFCRGKKDLPKASQHLTGCVKSMQGHWCKSQTSSGGWKCLPEPLQLRYSWVWSISLRGTGKWLWEVAAAGEGVNFFLRFFFF